MAESGGAEVITRCHVGDEHRVGTRKTDIRPVSEI